MDAVGADPSPKRLKLTNFFVKLLPNAEKQDIPGFLRRYQPTDVPRHPARLKRSVGRPRKSSATVSENIESCSDTESSQDKQGTLRGVYRSYSLSETKDCFLCETKSRGSC